MATRPTWIPSCTPGQMAPQMQVSIYTVCKSHPVLFASQLMKLHVRMTALPGPPLVSYPEHAALSSPFRLDATRPDDAPWRNSGERRPFVQSSHSAQRNLGFLTARRCHQLSSVEEAEVRQANEMWERHVVQGAYACYYVLNRLTERFKASKDACCYGSQPFAPVALCKVG